MNLDSLNIFSADSTIKFADLYQRDGLLMLDNIFKQFLKKKNSNLYVDFEELNNNPTQFSQKQQANLLIEIAKILEEFLSEIFAIKKENQQLQIKHQQLAIIYKIRRNFIQRQIARKYKAEDTIKLNARNILNLLGLSYPNNNNNNDDNENITKLELQLAHLINSHLQAEIKLSADKIKNIELYCAFALYNQQGKKLHKNGALFKLPKKIDFDNLVKTNNILKHNIEIKTAPEQSLSNRSGFKLTDPGFNLNQTLKEANYCIFCHNQGKDSCSIGLQEKDHSFKTNQLENQLSGCPLEEKISEMNLLKSAGFSIGALAMAVIDNPMIAATGHRICNDCMKSCIYQKQEPVDIPQIETKTLKDVLNLPYGFEIYALLTRWNPLNLQRPIVKIQSGHKILIAGLGPAGFTLAHHLLNEGHLVTAIDGLKIEPLAKEISGIDLAGNRHQFKPIKDINQIYEELDQRPVYGFGGVAEYGITNRWDKNFLKVIRLLLERRQNFRMFAGMRLGSAFDCKDLFDDYGFDHIALCLGAGRPNIIDIKNNFAKGIRSASDFLMTLQLTGADRKDLLTNLQVRLPIIVIGAGLTATDTACEALAYYAVQVEKFLERYEILCRHFCKKQVEQEWNEEEKTIAQTFLEHGKSIRKAKKNGKNITTLLKKWGGAVIVYRKKMHNSPAYRLNDHELTKALEEGIEFIEEATPTQAILDQFNHIKALKLQISQVQIRQKQITLAQTTKEIIIDAKSLFFATGTSPNKAPAYEDKIAFTLNKNTFQIIDFENNKLPAPTSPKAKNIGFLAAKDHSSGKTISFFGDLHPSFSGSVVKAMASAKKGYPLINQSLAKLKKTKTSPNYQEFLKKINQDFIVRVKEINILSDYIFELTIYAPLLAKKTKLGHIFRLHNYHSLAKRKKGSLLAMEGVAVTAYKIDAKKGLISVIIVNTGGSSSLVKNFKVNEPLIFMGPSGTPTPIDKNKTVMLIAAGRGIFPVASLAQEYKKNGCQVIFFCGYKKNQHIIRQKELEDCSDALIITTQEPPTIKLNRQADRIFHGKVTDAVIAYGKGQLGNIDINYKNINSIFTMGNEEMMHKIAQIRHKDLKNQLNPKHIGIVSLSNPMQCMLKGVCSQCLQKKVNQKTGKIKYFYSCLSQDQKLDEIDFNFLKNRCQQNSLSEKLTKLWIEYLN